MPRGIQPWRRGSTPEARQGQDRIAVRLPKPPPPPPPPSLQRPSSLTTHLRANQGIFSSSAFCAWLDL
eukprot:6982149-Pyramimonas_sp.AAC.1